MKPMRIWAVFLRQVYLYKRSFTRLLEVFYWPTVDILLWGFVSLYLQGASRNVPKFVTFFLGALILWDILFRAQQGITVSFLEDMWSRNLTNLFCSPLKMPEYIAGLVIVSVLKVCISFTVMSALAGVFYSFNIFVLGLKLIPLVLCLVAMGWAIGIATMGLILRFGQEAEVLAWAVAFLFLPVSAVFYPVKVLPPFLQKVAFFVPASHVFEAMREVISKGGFPLREVLIGGAESLAYLG
ncbi:MAG: ABC transporter permease, partial [Nitrospirae bacterium]